MGLVSNVEESKNRQNLRLLIFLTGEDKA